MDKVIEYFNGDVMSADVWKSKYRMTDANGIPMEDSPEDMHHRLAKEFARIEYSYKSTEKMTKESRDDLSVFGYNLWKKRDLQKQDEIEKEIFSYFAGFKYIVPQGSIMSNLGNDFIFGSLSNCFVIASPEDSYGGILRADEELVQLMKRRGGVGTTLDNLRPSYATVTNVAKTSSGVPSFAERYSNSTREVAQEGRRGALMLLLHVAHPDIFKFVTMKSDRTKVTGANISVMFTDYFMECVIEDKDFMCAFPIGGKVMIDQATFEAANYEEMISLPNGKYFMRIRAKKLFDEFVKMAWENAEPGAAYIDRIQNYSPDGVYIRFRPTKCNPCGEIWMGDYDACRLIAQNLFSAIDNPFTNEAYINEARLYEMFYIQQRLSDNLIDLEAEYIQRIIDKIKFDPEAKEVKAREISLWEKIKSTTLAGRRTGNGFTGLADMFAALNLKYDSVEALGTAITIMKIKMEAELDCTIDLSILRGKFEGHDSALEFEFHKPILKNYGIQLQSHLIGRNDFFQMLLDEFPAQAIRMTQYGRRNVSWSTVAPTGTVSLMTQTTSGLEPLFKAFYIRRKKINPNDKNVKIDFTDQNGDTWQEYPVLHPKFKEWIEMQVNNIDDGIIFRGIQFFDEYGKPDKAIKFDALSLSKKWVQKFFEISPWYKSEADDISWEKRIEMQAIIQKYTSNAISSTINLPSDVKEDVVYSIYMEAWKTGLKGVTIYRDGSRSGVLITDTKLTTHDKFGYNNAVKRPKKLEADYHCVSYKGSKYAVIVGILDGNPYELFAFENPLCEQQLNGEIIKQKEGIYSFVSPNYTIDNLQLTSDSSDEKLLTRWVSLLLRHGANPKFIAQQVEKSEVNITSFAKVISRILKTYIPDEVITSEACINCGEHTMIYEEGCKKCTSCGNSKC